MADTTIWTIKRLLTWTTGYFKKHHIDSPRLDAELLLSHVLGTTRIRLYTNYDEIVNPDELSLFHQYIEKRVNGFSTASIIGEKEFMGLTFHVNDKVLIPRPDTETWVEKMIQYYRNVPDLKVADLGTGSGCILISFLYYCKSAKGVGVDISGEALEIARQNGSTYNMDGRIEWRKGDYTGALREGEFFDGILTNPPYIPSDDIKGLDPEVKSEPHIALDGGKDGLRFYRKLAAGVPSHLKEGGFLVCETGIGEAPQVMEILGSSGSFDGFQIIQDLGGIERAVYCKRKKQL